MSAAVGPRRGRWLSVPVFVVVAGACGGGATRTLTAKRIEHPIPTLLRCPGLPYHGQPTRSALPAIAVPTLVLHRVDDPLVGSSMRGT